MLAALGVPEADAGTTAECLVTANLRGVGSHGLRLLPIYARRLELGVMQARPNLRVLAGGPAFVVIDGDNGLGPVVGAYAMDEAVAGHATRIEVTCRVRAPEAEITVLDNGTGLRAGRPDSQGIEIMHERARLVGAELTLVNRRPQGTGVTVRLPGGPTPSAHEPGEFRVIA